MSGYAQASRLLSRRAILAGSTQRAIECCPGNAGAIPSSLQRTAKLRGMPYAFMGDEVALIREIDRTSRRDIGSESEPDLETLPPQGRTLAPLSLAARPWLGDHLREP